MGTGGEKGETEVMLEVGIKAAKVHAVLFANDMGDGIQLAHKPTQPAQGRPDMSPFRRGFDVPEAMVLVRCRRCRKPDAQYSVDPRDGTGQWKVRNGFNCSARWARNTLIVLLRSKAHSVLAPAVTQP